MSPMNLRSKFALYIGNAYPHKNLDKLLDAFAILRHIHPNLKLTLAGREDVFYKRLLAHAPDGIEFVPNPSDEKIQSLIEKATIFVFPSRIEGFGLPPLEAMSMGVPVSASDIPALREVLGDAAAFFNPNEASHLASVLSDLLVLSERRTSLIQKGFEQIKRYSWNKMAVDIQTIYETCGKKSS